MTEQDAKKKWCPFTRVRSQVGSYNRDFGAVGIKDARCIASDCMAWEWYQLPDANGGNAGNGGCGLMGGHRQ